MRTGVFIGALCLIVASGCGGGSQLTTTPTLGLRWRSPYTIGFGQVRPTAIFNGGDPSGRFTDVKWRSWGGAQAHGSGTGWYVGQDQAVADGSYAPIQLVAYDLTVCGGHPVYRRLAVYFPTKGERFDPPNNGETQYDLCNGP